MHAHFIPVFITDTRYSKMGTFVKEQPVQKPSKCDQMLKSLRFFVTSYASF